MKPAQMPDGWPPWKFIFATGIECSYPVITGKDGRDRRIDELEKTFHYKFWKEDLALVREMGLRYLRYGPPYYKIHLAPGKYDWEFTDLAFEEMRRLGIVPIVDLCHFGVPDWVGNFQNPDWPELFSEYASAFAERFPWVQFYTPVNEIYVCAKLSAWNGIWNERKRDDHRAFVTALKNLCKANLLAASAICGYGPTPSSSRARARNTFMGAAAILRS
jgi:beta-glucosidase/6-phospho-beta-glucosidase/beta-galactosidase